MEKLSIKEIETAFDTMNDESRPIYKIANARSKNSAPEYDSDKLRSNSEKFSEARAKKSLAVMARFCNESE